MCVHTCAWVQVTHTHTHTHTHTLRLKGGRYVSVPRPTVDVVTLPEEKEVADEERHPFSAGASVWVAKSHAHTQTQARC